MYKVTIEVYENVSSKKKVESFHLEYEHALIAYKVGSDVASILNWNRHFSFSFSNEVSNLDEKKNVFIEGSVSLEKVKVGEPELTMAMMSVYCRDIRPTLDARS